MMVHLLMHYGLSTTSSTTRRQDACVFSSVRRKSWASTNQLRCARRKKRILMQAGVSTMWTWARAPSRSKWNFGVDCVPCKYFWELFPHLRSYSFNALSLAISLLEEQRWGILKAIKWNRSSICWVFLELIWNILDVQLTLIWFNI